MCLKGKREITWFNEDLLSNWAMKYCIYKENDSLVRKFIINDVDICLYCKNDRDELAVECIANGGQETCEWIKNYNG